MAIAIKSHFLCLVIYLLLTKLNAFQKIVTLRNFKIRGLWDSSLPESTNSRANASSIKSQEPNFLTEAGVSTLRKGLSQEFISIGLPALAGLVAEPLASFVDTAFLGRLGPVPLGAAGVALTAQYSFSKLSQDPLIRTTTSMVAGSNKRGKELSENVSAALVLAAAVGTAQCLFFLILGPQIIGNLLGPIPSSAAMKIPAVNYLRLRSLGAPAACLLIVCQGVFRGLGDTMTPLTCTLVGNLANVFLDALFIQTFKWGCGGAAAATSIGNFIAVFLLLRKLQSLTGFQISIKELLTLGPSFKAYSKAGSLILVRSFAKVWGYAYAGKAAAILGASAMAAYNLTFQIGVATTQLVEAVAIAAQSLLARELAEKDAYRRSVAARFIIWHALKLAVGFSAGLSTITYFAKYPVLRALTSDITVQNLAAGIMPVVLLTQVAKGLAYAANGIILGGSDWAVSTFSMWVSSIACVGLIRRGLDKGINSLETIWTALAWYFIFQVSTSVLRFSSGRGVWKTVDLFSLNLAKSSSTTEKLQKTAVEQTS